LEDGGYGGGVRSLLPLLAGAALVLPGAAAGEVVTDAPGAQEAALGIRPDGTPVVGYVNGPDVILATRTAGGWRSERIGGAPLTGRVARIVYGRQGRPYVLLEHVDYGWLRLVDRTGTRWRTVLLRGNGAGGPAGLTIDRAGRAVVTYATWSLAPRPRSSLFLVREQPTGRFVTRPVTRNGFPPASAPPVAVPVVIADGSVRILEAVGGPTGVVVLSWRHERGRWWGKIVYANTLGLPLGPAFVAPNGQTLDAAWTVFYAERVDTLLGTPYPRSQAVVALENSWAAGLLRTAAGYELAANERVGGLVAGRLVSPAATTELDGTLLGFARGSGDSRQLIVWRDGHLEWFESSALLQTRVTLSEPAHDMLAGSVQGGAGGSVAIYDEQARPRALLATVPLTADGTFTLSAPTGLYRAVYVHPLTNVAYGAARR